MLCTVLTVIKVLRYHIWFSWNTTDNYAKIIRSVLIGNQLPSYMRNMILILFYNVSQSYSEITCTSPISITSNKGYYKVRYNRISNYLRNISHFSFYFK